MKRRSCLKTMLATGAMAVAKGGEATRPIQLHVDMTVEPSREKEMLHNFKTIFQPEARKQPGYIDGTLLKLRSVVQGKDPEGANYRFVLIFESEELRQKWIASDLHKKVWPTVEKTLTRKDYTVLLYDKV